jgi:starch-binding outer membrane protein, SusD/RagB family
MKTVLKNINRKTMIFLSVFAMGFTSCHKDYLDPVPKTSLSDLVVFDTPTRIELQANGLYSSMKSGAFLGGRFQVYGDIRADDFLNKTANGVTGYGVWNHSLTENSINDVTNLWNAAYAAINQCNVFIAGMEDNADKFVPPTFAADFATVTAPQYIAEARLLRALAYQSLLTLYAKPYIAGAGNLGLPLRLLPEKSSENNNLARSTVGEVYAQILADLDYAETNLPLTRTNQSLNVTRAHRNTAIALKTRVYLAMGNYAAVITEANKIVPQNVAPFSATTGVAHALQANVTTVFASPQETLESILSFPFTAQNAPGTQNQLAYYFRASSGTNPGNGEYSLIGTGIVSNTGAWPATDARRGMVYTVSGESFLGKYPSGTPYIDKAPVIRYAEVLLNLAEAITRGNTGIVDARALALLNAVRRRSDATVTLAAADNAALTAAIMMERRIEFLGEGIRNQDIMRLNATIPGKGSIAQVLPTDLNYVWPIPFGELASNSLMVRNE